MVWKGYTVGKDFKNLKQPRRHGKERPLHQESGPLAPTPTPLLSGPSSTNLSCCCSSLAASTMGFGWLDRRARGFCDLDQCLWVIAVLPIVFMKLFISVTAVLLLHIFMVIERNHNSPIGRRKPWRIHPHTQKNLRPVDWLNQGPNYEWLAQSQSIMLSSYRHNNIMLPWVPSHTHTYLSSIYLFIQLSLSLLHSALPLPNLSTREERNHRGLAILELEESSSMILSHHHQ